MLGSWLHKAQREGAGLPLAVRLESVEDAEVRLERTGNRLALALVTLGLYVAASLLMQHSIGPRLIGDLPLLAARLRTRPMVHLPPRGRHRPVGATLGDFHLSQPQRCGRITRNHQR